MTKNVRPRLLDLFCGAGGAAMGYHRAGFDVVGVDIRPQPRYPFSFYEAGAFEFVSGLIDGPLLVAYDLFGETWESLDAFDAIHASPPCQAYSVLRRANIGAEYGELISPTRDLLNETELPWVIENVPGAPLLDPLVLCGSMFGLGSGERQLRRHRLFETSFAMQIPRCRHAGESIGVYGGAPNGRYTFENGRAKNGYRRGGYQGAPAEKREAMGIDWMNEAEINQAIPPVYTEFIGHQLIAHVRAAAAA